jgi:phospholipase/lecithinase/hemolysin
VGNAPALGLIPLFNREETTRNRAATLSNQFNKKLNDALNTFKQNSSLFIEVLDLHSLLEKFVTDYQGLGLDYQNPGVSNIANQLREGPLTVTKVLLNLISTQTITAHYYNEVDPIALRVFFDHAHVTKEGHERIAKEWLSLIYKIIDEANISQQPKSTPPMSLNPFGIFSTPDSQLSTGDIQKLSLRMRSTGR